MSDQNPRHIIGLDLGQSQDYSALVITSPYDDPPIYPIGHIERLPLRTRYTAIAEFVGQLVARLRTPIEVLAVSPVLGIPVTRFVKPDVALVVDYTGVGHPVADMFLDAELDCDLILVSITGGTKVTRDEDTGTFYVPKGDLVSAIQRTLQEERLRLPADDPHTPLLTKELAEFQAKIGTTGHISFGVVSDWRVGKHDDLVLAAALALWFGESRRAVEVW